MTTSIPAHAIADRGSPLVDTVPIRRAPPW
jgi:hypothetical protein